MKPMKGFTLVELIVFIVIIGMAAAAIFPILFSLRHAGSLPHQTEAQQIAQARMELILKQRHILGFSGFTDPCVGGSPPTICTVPSGFAVSAQIADNWNGDTNYKVITVDVSGDGSATLKSLVADYD